MNIINERIAALRKLMADEQIDIYIIPTSDFHSSEYVGEYFRVREYMSGFTGSAGTLYISADEACLWTDGRYFIQAADQLRDTEIRLMRSGQPGVPTLISYIDSHLKENGRLGFDGRVFPVSMGRKLSETAEAHHGSVVYNIDLVDRIWQDRPALSCDPVYMHDIRFCGAPSSDKLTELRAKMKENGCDVHILTSLDSIAWLLNLRGSDVTCNPVFLSYLAVTSEEAILFVNSRAVSSDVREYLEDLNVSIRDYNLIYDYAAAVDRGSKVLIDEDALNYSLYSILSEHTQTHNAPNPTVLMKAIKNPTEIDNLIRANIRDGVAMVRTLYWLDSTIGREPLTELSVADKLLENRSRQPDFRDISFATIAGYNAHGAIIHYEPTPETDASLEPHGFLLIDSGAQYDSGTTDITRTVALGPLTQEMKHHYTMVLRGNLNLSRAIFPEGCTGANLDILARQPFWDEHLDYNHGTGHGVGFFLNVHEGPHSLNWFPGRKSTSIPLKEGMVVTDEPGIYIEGAYGIRIENDLLCRRDIKTDHGQFMHWDILTLCPIDLRPVLVNEMTDSEITALNNYHARVRELLTPYLDHEETEWLKKATAPVSKD